MDYQLLMVLTWGLTAQFRSVSYCLLMIFMSCQDRQLKLVPPVATRLSDVRSHIMTRRVYTACFKKTGPLQLISHNFSSSHHSLIIFGTEILYLVLH